MVKVREEQPVIVDDVVHIELWLSQLGELRPEVNLSRLREVCELAEQAQEKAGASGDPQGGFSVGLMMAKILSELQVDEDGLAAAIVYHAVRENQITLRHVTQQFGEPVGKLVADTLKMAAISEIEFDDRKKVLGQRKNQLEQARRLLVSLVDDVRVALIKLAERTCAIREAARHPSAKSRGLAREVFDIYAPLAHRLGIGHLKWELEDHAFRLLEPYAYKRIAKLLDEKRTDRQDYIAEVVNTLNQHIRQAQIEATVFGRAKHIYSIWRKMHRKGIPFSEVYDVRALRILVPAREDCYRVLGIVHDLWRHVHQEFDDYIANPKENGYQSLHTAVVGPDGKMLEIQIRTEDMHQEAEYGLYSHWQYKVPPGASESDAYENRVEWLRRLLGGDEEDPEDMDLVSELSLERIYVFTPDGDVVDMTPSATPLDFAYRVHTEVGHKCRGAKVNGRVVPLNTQLVSGDRVEVIVGAQAEPLREWLHDHLGFITTSRARAQIQAWFGRRERQRNIDDGKRLLLSELNQLSMDNLELADLLDGTGYDSADQMFYDLAVGEISTGDLFAQASNVMNLDVAQPELNFNMPDADDREEPLVSGHGDLDYAMAECCQPVPGDLIVGVIEDDRAVQVHRQDCLQALRADVAGLQIKLKWRDGVQVTFPVNIEVLAYDRAGLLHDITGVLMHTETNVQEISTATDRRTNQALLTMTIEVARLDRLLQTLRAIAQLPNVISAKRTIAAGQR